MKLIKKIKEKIQKDSDFKEIAKGSSTAFSLNVIAKGLTYFFTLIVTRNLGAKAWGAYAISLIVLQIASMIGKLGIDTALLRFVAEYKAKKKIEVLKKIYQKSLKIVIPFSALISLTVYFLSPLLSDKLFHKAELTSFFKIISLVIVPSVIYALHLQIIRGLKKIKEFMLLQLGNSILCLGLLLIGIVIAKSYYTPIISYSLSIFIIMTISILIWQKQLKELNSKITQHTNNHSLSYKEIFSVAFPLLLSTSLALIMGSTDTVMLGIFKNMEETGIYNVALKLSMITSMVLTAVNTISAPKFAEFFGKNDYQSLKKTAYQSTKLIFLFSTPVILVFFLFPKQCMGLFGNEFQKGAIVLIILSLGQFVNALTGSVGLILIMTGKHITHRNIMIVSTFGNFFLNLILINKFGILGAAIATTLTQTIGNLTAMFFVKKYYGFYTIKGILK